MGWAGKGKIPQPAQPQSTAAVRGSSGAAHLPVSPPVRSPARWGSMAGSPLLHGPRAGGVGLLVLLLLGLLGPPRTLCARPVKVRPGSGTGLGLGGGGCYRRGSVPGRWPLILAGPSSRDLWRDRPWGPGVQPPVCAQAMPASVSWVCGWQYLGVVWLPRPARTRRWARPCPARRPWRCPRA